VIERIWTGAGAWGAVRLALSPMSAAFGAVVAARNARFDRGEGVHTVACPALSIGNLTVGGTGKTPVAAWCARALREAGASPAIVLRGYGDDEWRVHQLLSPDVPVIRDADRVRGIATAVSGGADCVVLDDAFQHRRAARVSDVVLLAADGWRPAVRLLPAGPYREPWRALRRASLIVITAKTASAERVSSLRAAIRAEVGDAVPIAEIGLEAGALHQVRPAAVAVSGETDSSSLATQPLAAVRDRSVLAVSAIGDPAAFERALTQAGADVTARRFRDHHAFTADEARALARSVPDGGVVVCTLKDAVKLAPLWPHASQPLWYLSQTIVVRDGADALAGAVHRVLAARAAASRSSRPLAG
jgi:tetraacyldisaccharide 4'-kinase